VKTGGEVQLHSGNGMNPAQEIKNLDHLGLVSMIDEMGLVDAINQLVGQHPQERVSAGHVVKAMILNGLGFVSAILMPWKLHNQLLKPLLNLAIRRSLALLS